MRALPPFEKMVEYYKAMLFYGRYAELRPARLPAPLFMLDNVNYSSAVVDDPLPIRELLCLFEVEPGYASVTGDCEVGSIVRELEIRRAQRYAEHCGLDGADRIRSVVERTVAVSTAGATGATNSVLTAARMRCLARGETGRRAIVFNTPCYCLPDGFSRAHGLVPRPVEGARADLFLPPLEEIIAAVDDRTLACFLTFPANPALWSWGAADVPALRRLIAHCQDRGVVLVADTVFQDLCWGAEPAPEIFALARDPRLLAKVWSPSKDRPLACGYRVGYALADAELEPWLNQAEGLAKNSSSTAGQVWLAFDCLFRLALLAGELEREHFDLLAGKYLFGYGARELGAREMHARTAASGLFARYAARTAAFEATVGAHLREVHGWLAETRCFEPAPEPGFGNIVMTRIRPPYDAGGEDGIFVDALVATHVTSTTGGCFGLRHDPGVWIRVAVGGAPVADVLNALTRLETYLIRRAP